MKIAQKNLAVLFLLLPFFGSEVRADAPVAVDSAENFQLFYRLFGPFPARGAQARLAKLRHEAEAAGGDFKVELMKRVRPFLLAEATDAFKMVAHEQDKTIDADLYAAKLLEAKLETPYKNAHDGADIYTADAATLSDHVFTYFVNPYLTDVLKRLELPEQTRDLSLTTLMEYLHYVRIGLNYGQTFINVANQTLDNFGIPKA